MALVGLGFVLYLVFMEQDHTHQELTWDQTTAELDSIRKQFCELHEPKEKDEAALKALRYRCVELFYARVALLRGAQK